MPHPAPPPNPQASAIEWRTESTQKAPQAIVSVQECSADAVLKRAYANTATLWQGDFHNAKQVLAAIKKRLRKPAAKAANQSKHPAEIFHTHRMQQAQQARLINMLAVEVQPGFTLKLSRAPDIHAALLEVYGEENTRSFLLPLNQLLGFIGAHEWHKKGVDIAALGAHIHVPFGVFSPLRGEYLDLIAQAPLPPNCRTAFDIGTGSGVIAALLARRGVPAVTATDTNPRAIACAHANLKRLGLSEKVVLQQTDLFPPGKADLIVCNPPWLPAKPSSAVETALYDPESAMLKGFLNGVAKHLNESGEAWLIMSDLAEYLGLRTSDELAQIISHAGLQIAGTICTQPGHNKAKNPHDPLAFARSRETTRLYRLTTI
ncbi:methyltransferase [Neisseria wadsworthii]|uniref:Methyltransferase n=1 Tax=Neisseria wadsworthii 9715 TaxID=1030841 RepID=G4CSY6_9NEIS|nr:class I SAM-dependent methyltransferase [Neisseria wadsworthii]EGZ44483.1 methyltransferase [Neisseria wadsworthii 9715]QMT35799.1 class I SAM-dependent methyltransferase [Neisseria wadsworthii]